MKLNVRLARLFGIGMFLTILSFVMLQAQPGIDWRLIGPWSGNITDIKVKYINDIMRNDGTHRDSIVVASYGAGVFIADAGRVEGAILDNSAGWIPRNTGLPSLKVTALAIRGIGQGDSMFVGLDGYGIYKTTNAGLTWERAFGLGDAMGTRVINDIAIHPNQSWEAYVATNQGLYKTTSFGVTWIPMNNNNNGVWKNVKMHEYTTQKVYATTNGQLYRSTDNGTTWGGPYSVNGSAQVTAMALAYSALDTLWVGCSDGSVKEVTFPLGIGFRSVDKSSGLIPGNSVTSMSLIAKYAPPGATEIFGVTSYPDSIITNDTIYMSTKNGVFKSGSKGSTWAQVNVGLGTTNTSAICTYTVHNGTYPVVGSAKTWEAIYHDVFIGTTFGGLYAGKTNEQATGSAVSWAKVDKGIPVGGLRAVSVTPTLSEVVYTGGGYIMSNGVATGVLFKTMNASTASPTWKIVYPSDTATSGLYVMDISTDWRNKGHVLVADSIYGLIRSTDAGSTWAIVPNTTNATAVYINCMNDTIQFVARRTNGNGTSQILRSTDQGETWTALSQVFNYPITSITMDSVEVDKGAVQTLYVGTWGAGVYKSTDLGNTFRQVNRGTISWLVYSVSVGKDFVVVGTDFGNYKSANKGEDWTDYNLMGTFNDGTAILPTYPYNWEKVPSVYTIRGDSTWSILLNGTETKNQGIFYSKDGRTWTSAAVTDSLPAYTTGYSPFSSLDDYMPIGGAPLLMRDLDMMWKWDQGGLGTAIAAYAASETRAIFARNNTGFPGDPIVAIPGEIENPIPGGNSDADTIFVWIPDTLSALRGVGATGEDYYDIPISVKNIEKADAFKVAINIPDNYFENATAYSYSGFTAANSPIITDGTVTEGLTVYATCDGFDSTAIPAPGADKYSNTITIGDTTTFYCTNPNGKFRNDRDVLFKIRVSIKEKTPNYTLSDSTPRGNPTEYASNRTTDLFLMNGRGSATSSGTPLTLGTIFFTKQAGDYSSLWLAGYTAPPGSILTGKNNSFVPYDKAKFSVPGTGGGIDSVGTFWLRREPGGLHSDNSALPGGAPIGKDMYNPFVDANVPIGFRGEVGSSYIAGDTANHVNDNIWNPIQNTGRSMIIGVTGNDLTYPYLTYNNFPEKPFRTGDAIGAFYYRNDSLVCGGWGVWTPSSNGSSGGAAITVWGDDDRTALKDGFVENEKIYFKVYDSRYKKIWDVDEVTFRVGDGLYHTDGIADVSSLKAKNFNNFGIKLRVGWNLVSANITPRWTEMETIFKNVVATNNFTLVKDQDGLVYWPQIGLNWLPYWSVDQAYWVYMYSVTGGIDPIDTVFMQGAPIDITRNTISLRQGWNLLPYWGNKPTMISTALASLVNYDPNLLVRGRAGTVDGDVGNNTGMVWWPAVGSNGIGYMVPGQGYELYLNNVNGNGYLLFQYPSSVQANIGAMNGGIPGISLPKKAVASIYNPTVTPISQAIGFKFDGYKLREGDELGVFTRDGICVGAGKFEGGKTNAIAVSVFGDFAVFEDAQKVGAIEGDELVVKLYVDGQEYTPVISNLNWIVGDGSVLTFKAGAIVSATATIKDIAVDESLPTSYEIAQNYPNPFNPTTNIKYQLPVDGFVKIKIFDMLGREIKSLVNQEQKAGYYTIEWDATNNQGRKAATGVYFYQIEASNFKKTMKMMLMK